MLHLLFPYFLLGGFIAIPLLVISYLLHQRSAQRKVSSLHLWQGIATKPSGGSKILVKFPPWLFWLELVIICLLLFASTTPLFRHSSQRFPITVILDDSFSLQADHKKILEEAKKRLVNELAHFKPSQIQVIWARSSAVYGGEFTPKQISEILDQWQALYSESSLLEAISLAKQKSKRNDRILIITDKETAYDPTLFSSNIKYIALGRSMKNCCLSSATRLTNFEQKTEILLIEVKNFSPKKTSQMVSIFDFQKNLLTQQPVELGPNQSQVVKISIPIQADQLLVRLNDDALLSDNEQILLPKRSLLLTAYLDFSSPSLQQLVKKALATTDVSLTANKEVADLYFTDRNIGLLGLPCWQIHFPSHQGNKVKAKIFSNAFIIKKQHPLSAGISLDHVLWAGATDLQLNNGTPVIMHQETPLILDMPLTNNKRIITFNLFPAGSSVIYQPIWPILFSNLVNWRKQFTFGFSQNYISCNQWISYTAKSTNKKLLLINPLGEKTEIRTSAISYTTGFTPQIPGLYTILEDEHPSSCVALINNEEESNLWEMKTMTIDHWQNSFHDLGFCDLTPLFLFLILCLLLCQIILISKYKQR